MIVARFIQVIDMQIKLRTSRIVLQLKLLVIVGAILTIMTWIGV